MVDGLSSIPFPPNVADFRPPHLEVYRTLGIMIQVTIVPLLMIEWVMNPALEMQVYTLFLGDTGGFLLRSLRTPLPVTACPQDFGCSY